ncbi:MAG: helix-turn-helix transcriptional regulator [bacterium]|nr:helix-turn-helix transcriptional regulator [bacterium]
MTTIATAADLGAAVRLRRRERNLTLAETAELAGVGVRFMSELENGKPTVRLSKVMDVMGALGLELRVGTVVQAKGEQPAPVSPVDDAFGLAGLMGEVKGILEEDAT